MLFSQSQGRKVVSTASADTVGHIAGYVIDPAVGKVVALSLTKTPKSGTMLPWSDITAFGVDAVTVADDELIVEADEKLAPLAGKAHAILKKRVLTTSGHEIGIVNDVDFDPAAGTIVSLILDTQTIEGGRLIGVGSYAVVVHA